MPWLQRWELRRRVSKLQGCVKTLRFGGAVFSALSEQLISSSAFRGVQQEKWIIFSRHVQLELNFVSLFFWFKLLSTKVIQVVTLKLYQRWLNVFDKPLGSRRLLKHFHFGILFLAENKKIVQLNCYATMKTMEKFKNSKFESKLPW